MGDVGEMNHTIYVSNLNEKIKKAVLKKSLHRYEATDNWSVAVACCCNHFYVAKCWKLKLSVAGKRSLYGVTVVTMYYGEYAVIGCAVGPLVTHILLLHVLL